MMKVLICFFVVFVLVVVIFKSDLLIGEIVVNGLVISIKNYSFVIKNCDMFLIKEIFLK